jgi:hypothetical protein
MLLLPITSACGSLGGGRISEEDLLSLLDMKKTQIMSKLRDYKEGTMAMEESHMVFPVLIFENGLTFYFVNSDDDLPLQVECSDGITIRGVNRDMNFSQVQEKLGKKEVVETWIANEDVKGYKLEYNLDKFLIKFVSYENTGEASSMIISK